MKLLQTINEGLYIVSGWLIVGFRYLLAGVLYLAGAGLIVYAVYRLFAEMSAQYGVGAFVLHVIICSALFIGGSLVVAFGWYFKESAKDAKDW